MNLHTAGKLNPAAEGARLSPLISEFLGYVNRHLCSPLDIGQIADRLYVSESYLFRLFKKELHQTPQKYIREKRLMMARKMLSEGERPTAVCTRFGLHHLLSELRGLFRVPALGAGEVLNS